MNVKFHQIDVFSSGCGPHTCFLYQKDVPEIGDMLFLASDRGSISFITFSGTKVSRPDEFTRSCTNNHQGAIQCMFLCFTSKLLPAQSAPAGILLTGGRDQTIKVWNPLSGSKSLLQTLVGHHGVVTALVDSKDGTFLSCSTDATVKMWAPQRGRTIMLNPYFECMVSISLGRGIWLSSMTINFAGAWTCFVGDSIGSIHLLRKGSNPNSPDYYAAHFNNQLVKHKQWDNVGDLGINLLKLLEADNYLIVLSSDTTAKILDATLGHQICIFKNPRRDCYVGAEWDEIEGVLYLLDEMGYMDLASISKSVLLRSVELVRPSSRQQANILSSHKDKVTASMCKYSLPYSFLILFPRTTTMDHNMSKLAGSGNVALWARDYDHTCVKFSGHDGPIIAIGSISPFDIHCSLDDGGESQEVERKALAPFVKANTQRVIIEEQVFYSVGADNTIRSWDQYEKKEIFQHKVREPHEITCCKLLWSLNCIAIGHENGYLSLCNIDSGSTVVSISLSNALSALCEGRNAHSHILLGADHGGHIAIWNLTLFQTNPTLIPTDSVRMGFHDREDPGILSLAFHYDTRTVFSGGNDRTIRYWKLGMDSSSVLSGHSEAVCCMEVSLNFLATGDEGGETILWRLVRSGTIVSDLVPLARWPTNALSSSRSILDMTEISPSRIYVVQAGLIEKVMIWEVVLQPRHVSKNRRTFQVRAQDLEKLSVGSPASSVLDSLEMSNSVELEGESKVDAEGSDGGTYLKRNTSDLILYDDQNPYLYITVLCRQSLVVEELDVCSAELTCTSSGDLLEVYLGTTEGPILCYRLGNIKPN